MSSQLTNAIAAAALADDITEARVASSSPTNAQILTAAKAAYAAYQKVVDASTLALVNIINTGSLTSEIQTLDSTNWNSGGITESVVDPIFASVDVQTAIGIAKSEMRGYSVGAYSNALPNNKVGVAGFVRSLNGQAHKGLYVELDLFKSVVSTDSGSNLQLGQWLQDPSDLHTNLLGLYINTPVRGVSVNLKILMDESLRPFGFMESTGAKVNLPVSTSPFAGSTSIF